MKPITTDRLIIKEAELSDAPFIYALMNSPGWLQYIGDRGIRSMKDAENYIQTSLLDNYKKQGLGLYKMCLKTDEKAIGLCGFLKRDYLDEPDLGFALLPQYAGKGYMFEAATRLIENSDFSKIYAITVLENDRSKKLLVHLGFSPESKINPSGTELQLYGLALN